MRSLIVHLPTEGSLIELETSSIRALSYCIWEFSNSIRTLFNWIRELSKYLKSSLINWVYVNLQQNISRLVLVPQTTADFTSRVTEREDRGSNPGLATWIFIDWLFPAFKSRYGWKIAKSTSILKTTNQPTNQRRESARVTSLLHVNSLW